MSTTKPRRPGGLKPAGRRLWDTTVDEFDLAEHELALLAQAARTADTLDVLQRALDADGPVIDSPQGRKAHPALSELRQLRIVLARLLAALGMPSGIKHEQQLPARRVRGVYRIGSAS